MIKAMISAISFYLFPILVGRVVMLFFNKRGREDLLSVINYFTFGSLFLFFLTFFVYLLSLKFLTTAFFVNGFPIILKSLFILFIVFNLHAIISVHIIFKKYWRPALWIMIIGSVIFGLWRWGTSYPLPLTWDFFHHQTLVNLIKMGQLSFFPSEISDTFRFNGYLPLFHLLLAWPQLVFNPSILSFYWWLEFLHLLTTLAAVYFLTINLLKNQSSAIIATIFSGLIFESYMIYTSLFLIPQTLTAVVFAFLITKFLTTKPSFKESLFNLLFLLMLHYIIGLVAVGLLFLIIFLSSKRNLTLFKKTANLAIYALLILILVFTQVSLPVNFNFLNRGEAKAFNYTISEKIEYFKIFSGYVLFCFFLLGLGVSIQRKSSTLKILLIATLTLIALIALPLPYGLKLYVLAHYPVSLFATVGFLVFINFLKIKPLKILALFVFILVILSLFLSSTRFIKNLLRHPSSNALVSQEEVKAAEFLKKHFGDKKILLVSDPATQHILEALSGINTQGGAYSNEVTREILDQASQQSNPYQIKEKLLQIEDNVATEKPDILLFVMSGRYFRWQESSIDKKKDLSFNIWSPVDLNLRNLKSTEILSKGEVFQKIYRNKSLVILQTSFSL